MLKEDVETVDGLINQLGFGGSVYKLPWGRIKKYLEESCQLPTTQVKTPAAPTPVGEICAHYNPGWSCPFGRRACCDEVGACNIVPRKLLLT